MFDATGPGIDGVHRDAAALEPAGELEREVHGGELGARVGAHEGVAALELEIVEVERCHPVGIGRDVHDARRGALEQARQQPQGELEHRQVVDREGELDSLGVALARLADEARVVDQHVQGPAARQELGGGAVDRLARGEVAEQDLGALAAVLGGDLELDAAALLRAAAVQHHVGPSPGERAGDGAAMAVGGAGHQADAALHVAHSAPPHSRPTPKRCR